MSTTMTEAEIEPTPVSQEARPEIERSPAQFFFEVGFGACYAEAVVRNGEVPFVLTDDIIERAWQIAPEAHDDHAEFDRYLALTRALPASAQPTAVSGEVVEAGGWTGLAADLFRLHRAAYPAPWCWEQCGEKCDDPVIGAAWWEDDEDCAPIAGELVPLADNIEREAYREMIAGEMQSHADGGASANAALIVWLRNHVVEILNGLAALSHPPSPSTPDDRQGLVEASFREAEQKLLDAEPAPDHMRAVRKIDRKQALGILSACRRKALSAPPAPATQAGDDPLGDGEDFGVTGEWWGSEPAPATLPASGDVVEKAAADLLGLELTPISDPHAGAKNGKELIRAQAIGRKLAALAQSHPASDEGWCNYADCARSRRKKTSATPEPSPAASSTGADRPLNMCAHGADRDTYCGYCGGYSKGSQ